MVMAAMFVAACTPQETSNDTTNGNEIADMPNIKVNYPTTEKIDVVDDYFGTQVADPYRWLEKDDSSATKDWVGRQNEATFGYLEQIPFREKDPSTSGRHVELSEIRSTF